MYKVPKFMMANDHVKERGLIEFIHVVVFFILDFVHYLL
jgi:hypothetical protein